MVKHRADYDALFEEFMTGYIETQSSGDGVPWCMSIEMLSQAFASFVMTVKNETNMMQDIEVATCRLLKEYLSYHKTNIKMFGTVRINGTPKLTVTGIRLKKVPSA